MRRERTTPRLLRTARNLRLPIELLVNSVQRKGTRTLSVSHVLRVLVVEVERRAHLALQLIMHLVLRYSVSRLRRLSIASGASVNGNGGG